MPSACIYFDNNSTTKPYPKVISIIQKTLSGHYANPFTQYRIGKEAHDAMEKSRSKIKKMLGIWQKETLIFTSCATESNNMVIRGRVAMYRTIPHIIISSIEHSSVYQTCLDLEKSNKCSLSIIPTDCQGKLDIEKLDSEINKHAHHLALISIILANNETGVIQDLGAIIKTCKGQFLHIDATQYIGKYSIKISRLGIQSMTFGSHKFHGPRLGALYLKDLHEIKNVCCTGGRSEYNLRSGTPNVAYILGMEKALEISMNHKNHVGQLRDYMENEIKKIPNTKINSGSVDRLYNTLSIVLPIKGESKKLIQYLEKNNIYVNIGSACNRNTRSRILKSLGLTQKDTDSTLRISLSFLNTKKECEFFLKVLKKFLNDKF